MQELRKALSCMDVSVAVLQVPKSNSAGWQRGMDVPTSLTPLPPLPLRWVMGLKPAAVALRNRCAGAAEAGAGPRDRGGGAGPIGAPDEG